MRNTHRKAPKSDNVYLKLLVKFYRFLARKLSPSYHPIRRIIASTISHGVLAEVLLKLGDLG